MMKERIAGSGDGWIVGIYFWYDETVENGPGYALRCLNLETGEKRTVRYPTLPIFNPKNGKKPGFFKC